MVSVPYPLIFLDIDGTLIDVAETISERTRAALQRAEEAGCTLVLSTARNRHSVEPIAAQIGTPTYAILSNGAIVENLRTREVILKITLTRTVVREAVRLAHGFELAALCFGARDDGGRTVYADRRRPLPARYLEANHARLVYCNDLADELEHLPVSMSVYGPQAVVQELANVWKSRLGLGVSVFEGASPRNGCWVTYCTPAQTSKAYGAQTIAQLLSIPSEQTLAIGDERNDIELLRWAGLGVCMGDGHAEARACADFVTGSLAEDGAAQAIERFVLRLTRGEHADKKPE